jgi:uncharacterized protein YabE (DUF348 family)
MLVWSKKRTYLLAGLISIGLLLGSQFFALQKPVTIYVDGKKIETRAYFARTVADVLEKNQISLNEKDLVEPALNSVLEKETNIRVTRAFKVKVIADGQTREIISTPVTVKKAIELASVKMGKEDIVKTVLTDKTKPNQEIEVIRVTTEEVQVEEPVEFRLERTIDNTLEKGLTRTIQAGKNGLALNTVKIVYHNGQEVKRELVDSKIVNEPVNRVVAMGSITNVSRSGTNLNFREARYMSASAYTYTGNRTATGKQPAVGLVAVDPSVIPLGTRLYVEGYGYAQAADTGGSIKGDRIDLFMEDRSQCLNWGRRTVKVYILD